MRPSFATCVAVTCFGAAVLLAAIGYEYAQVKGTLGADLARMFKPIDPEKVKFRAAMTSLDTYRPDSFDILFTVESVPPQGRRFALREHADYYAKVLRYRPAQMEAYVFLGYCYYHQGDIDAAVKAYQQAIELNPSFFWPYYNLGVIFFNQKNYKLATVYLKRAVELEPADTLQVVFRSHIYREVLSQRSVDAEWLHQNLNAHYKKAYEALLVSSVYLKQGAGRTLPPLPVQLF